MTDDFSPMLLLAFGFADGPTAAAVQRELTDLLDVEPGDLRIEQVGGTPEFVDGSAVVLAGRIRQQRADAAIHVVKRYGGEVLTDVPEAWAHPNTTA